MSVYSDKDIKNALENSHIICDPEPVMVNGSSIDVTLGHYYYLAKSLNKSKIFNPFSEKSTKDYFGQYLEAKKWKEIKNSLSDKDLIDLEYLSGIDDNHPVILLEPNERILAHTNEFIGIKPPGTSSMQARSTTGRMGISACYCAGWGDPGYINRWTMEIHNLNENVCVPLPIGYRIAQIVFSETGEVDKEYSKSTGNYQNFSSEDLEDIKKNWRPEMMLPKAYASEIKIPQRPNGMARGIK